MRNQEAKQFVLFAWAAAIATALSLPVVCHAAAAGWKPEQNVEIVVFTPPGSGVDRYARLMQQLFTEKKLIEGPSSVVNKPGGGTALAMVYLNQHPGNGHYFLLMTPTGLTNHIIGASNTSYMDATPLALLFAEPPVFAVRADSPFKTGKDLADRLKASPGGTSFAFASSLGGLNHISVAQLVKAVGGSVKNLKTVVFNGSGEAITALLGGHVDVALASAPGFLPHVEGGKIRILAVTAEQRLGGALSAVPTWKEQGSDVVFRMWTVVIGPKGMTEGQIRHWDSVFARLVQLPEWKQTLTKNQAESAYLNAADARKFLDREYATFSSLLTELNMAKPAPAAGR